MRSPPSVAGFDIEEPARRQQAPALQIMLDPRPTADLPILRMAHPTMLAVLADLAFLEEPDRALADTVDDAVGMHLAQVPPLRATRVVPALLSAHRAGHDSWAPNRSPVGR